MEDHPRAVGDIPPERRSEEDAPGADDETDATTEPVKSPSTPGPESIPSEEEVSENLPGVPQEDRD